MMRKLFLFSLTLVFALALAACKKEPKVEYDSEMEVNVAINYTSGGQLMSISYQKDSAYQSTIDNKTYTKGDLLPAWSVIGDKLNIKFNDKAVSSDQNTNAQFTRLQTEEFKGVDLVNGTGALIGPEGVKGNFVDIGKYLKDMPNLKAFLDANPSVKVSMTAADGGIYFTPYFDGFGEMEQMFLVRIDWIEDILDAEDPTFDTTPGVVPNNLTKRTVTTPIDTKITVAKPDGGTREVTKKYTNNILDVLKNLSNPTGADVANAFRSHMQNTYGNQGYAKLSHVFTGTDAAYDTDELLALMYVVKSNPRYLTSDHTDGAKDAVEVLFPRENTGNRIANLIRGLEMFGIRGVFSRHEYLYFDKDGNIQDVRYEDKFMDAIDALSHMYKDKLILQNPEDGKHNWRKELLEGANGFMTYDYNATSTADSLITKGQEKDPDFKFEAILPPVVDWLGDGNYFHFTEATRSVKNEAWGIPAHVAKDKNKLYRILKLVDEMYDYKTEESVGTIHLYGPKGWTDGTIQYGNDTVYKLSAKAKAEMASLAGGNHINYLRQYVGATMPIGHIRSMGLEFQTLSAQGIEGIDRINTAVKAGVLKLAGQVDSTNPWFQLSPTFFPITKSAQELIESAATFRTLYEDDKLITLVKDGFSGANGSKSRTDYKAMFTLGNQNVYTNVYIKAYREAYESLNK